MNTFLAFIASSIPIGVPLLFGSTGEIITEKSGHLNLGIPGIMYVGGISGVIGAFLYENACSNDIAMMSPLLAVLIPLLASIAGSVLMGLIYSFLTVTLRVNQNVSGLALTTFGIGIGNFFGGSLIKLVDSDMPSIILTKTSSFFRTSLPFAKDLGWFGEIFLSHDFLTYASII
ncbi:MAG: ABC transporter permease, partial [Clostridia bacterium]|nr:ABC transporter permease [Clostridia bacterium]